jgi:hypothetical protein
LRKDIDKDDDDDDDDDDEDDEEEEEEEDEARESSPRNSSAIKAARTLRMTGGLSTAVTGPPRCEANRI